MLSRLSRRFEALLSEEEIASLVEPSATSTLIARRVLEFAGESDTVPRCICPLRRPACVVQVDGDGDPRSGSCMEWGQPLAVPRAMIRLYRFSGSTWASAVRRANNLDGPEPKLGDGTLLLGEGVVAGRAYRLVAVAPGCRSRSELVLPEVPRSPSTTLFLLCLGAAITDGAGDEVILGRSVLAADLLTIDTSAVDLALHGRPLTVTMDEQKYLVFSSEAPHGELVGEREYLALHTQERLKGIDIFVDLTRFKIWRSGRHCTKVLDDDGKPTTKRLTQRAVRVAAAYIRRPGIPMQAYACGAYEDRDVAPRSAAVMFSQMRRSIRGAEFLVMSGTGAAPGQSDFVFEPGGRTWCVVTHPAALPTSPRSTPR